MKFTDANKSRPTSKIKFRPKANLLRCDGRDRNFGEIVSDFETSEGNQKRLLCESNNFVLCTILIAEKSHAGSSWSEWTAMSRKSWRCSKLSIHWQTTIHTRMWSDKKEFTQHYCFGATLSGLTWKGPPNFVYLCHKSNNELAVQGHSTAVRELKNLNAKMSVVVFMTQSFQTEFISVQFCGLNVIPPSPTPLICRWAVTYCNEAFSLSLSPRREAGDVWCLPPVWNLRAVIWFHFANILSCSSA